MHMLLYKRTEPRHTALFLQAWSLRYVLIASHLIPCRWVSASILETLASFQYYNNSFSLALCRAPLCVTHTISSYPLAQQPTVGHGVLIIDASRSHSDSPQSAGILWTSVRPFAETCSWQHTTITRDKHPCFRQDSNPQSQHASGRRPKP
jgi:hypothetical protein